jgi:hypothetical protein
MLHHFEGKPLPRPTDARTRMLRALFFSFACLLAGCGAPAAFMPAAHVTGLSPDGSQYASEYPIEADKRHIGDAKLWSRGVYRDDPEGKTETLVHVGLLLDNNESAPIRLDDKGIMLEDVQLDDGTTLYEIPPAHIEGDLTVPPAKSRQINVYFALPRRLWPMDVLMYRVRWTVQAGSSFVRRTPFVRNGYRPGDYPGYAYGYYYPYGYAYFGYSPYYWPYRPLYVPYGVRFRGRVDPFFPRAYSSPRTYARPRPR